MENNATAKIALMKNELLLLIAIIEKEKAIYDHVNYDSLDDEEAGNIGDEHEVINGVWSMLKASFDENFK